MKKVIVTGANGFIGTALLKELTENNVEVIAVIKNEDENIDAIKHLQGVKIVYCEMDNIEKLPELVSDRDADTCIHLAWAGSTGNSRADYKMQLKNTEYALDTINAIAAMKVKRFVCAGTLAELDVLYYHHLDGATPNPVSMYGIAKITANYMTKVECTRLGIEHIWCRLSNTYGVGNFTNNFVNFASKTMLSGKRAAFTAGEQTYDFVYISDIAKAIRLCAKSGKTNSTYYLGSTKKRKLKEYITIIRDTIDPSIPLYLGEIPFNGTPLPPEEYDCSKLVEDTGYEPEVDFEDGIKKTIDWLKKQ